MIDLLGIALLVGAGFTHSVTSGLVVAGVCALLPRLMLFALLLRHQSLAESHIIEGERK